MGKLFFEYFDTKISWLHSVFLIKVKYKRQIKLDLQFHTRTQGKARRDATRALGC